MTVPPPHPSEAVSVPPPRPSEPVQGSTTSHGRISVILAAIALAVAAISTVVGMAILVGTRGMYTLYSAVSTASLLLEALLCIAALVFGILGLRRDQSRGLAGIGTGAAGALVAGILIGMLGTLTSILLQQPVTL